MERNTGMLISAVNSANKKDEMIKKVKEGTAHWQKTGRSIVRSQGKKGC